MQTDIFSGRYITLQEANALEFGLHFKDEYDFCDFIEHNIDVICEEDLGIKLHSYKKQYIIPLRHRRNIFRRIDFFIKSQCGLNIIIECKVPTDPVGDLSKAIGQLLAYKALLNNNGIPVHRLILFSTKVDLLSAQIIKENRLPIEFVIMDKGKTLQICAVHQ